ncbi:MAG: DUF58 domain-containing protein [Defluviitaleaceae bacterium]|nr:DUF58 domain-containing protein [Defluviitaleaceae bacterium]
MVVIVIGVAIASLILLQSWLYRRFWKHGLTAEVKFSTKEAFEGDTLFLIEEFTNKKLLPLPWLFVEIRLPAQLDFGENVGGTGGAFGVKTQRDLFSIKVYEKLRRKLPFTASQRGFYTLGEVNLKVGNLLHTKRFEGFFKTYQELTVYPKLLDEDKEMDMLYKNLDAAILSNSLINPDPFEFKGIRDYLPTDSLKNINFKASAIQQQLMVNIHAPVSARRLEIVLNLQPYNNHPYKEIYEQGIRLAATVASKYIHDDVKVGFYTNGRDGHTNKMPYIPMGRSSAHLQTILESLAHINTSNAPSGIATHLSQLMNPDAVYLIISSYYGEDLADALEHLKSKGISYVVIMPMETSLLKAAPQRDDILVWQATK